WTAGGHCLTGPSRPTGPNHWSAGGSSRRRPTSLFVKRAAGRSVASSGFLRLGNLKGRRSGPVAQLVLVRLLGVMPGVDGDERRLAVFAQAAGILPIHHRAAGENHDIIRFVERDRQMFPAHEVAAHRVTPAHVAPLVTKGIELVEQVILAIV